MEKEIISNKKDENISSPSKELGISWICKSIKEVTPEGIKNCWNTFKNNVSDPQALTLEMIEQQMNLKNQRDEEDVANDDEEEIDEEGMNSDDEMV